MEREGQREDNGMEDMEEEAEEYETVSEKEQGPEKEKEPSTRRGGTGRSPQ